MVEVLICSHRSATSGCVVREQRTGSVLTQGRMSTLAFSAVSEVSAVVAQAGGEQSLRELLIDFEALACHHIEAVRDDFSEAVKATLAKRVSFVCSRRDCRAPTSGPQMDSEKALNVGVAAHITAASERGPRFDASLTPEQRSSVDNGIWLCQTCGKLVDNDGIRFPADELRSWKR